MQMEIDPRTGPSGDAMAAVGAPPPLDRRHFVVVAAGLMAIALLGGCAAAGDRNYCYGTARVGVKGRRIKPVPCPEGEE